MTTKTEIIVHCTDTPRSWMEGNSGQEKVDEIRRWHVRDRGWSDIGYNHVIDVDGTILGGRDLDNDGDFAEETGAHAKGYNKTSIGIALIGGHGGAADDRFIDHFTAEQGAALRRLIEKLERRFGPLKVKGHNQYANKACPSFHVPTWLARGRVKPARTSPVQSTSIQTAATGIATAGGGAVGAVTQLEGTNQTVALVFLGLIVLMFMYLMRERIKHWANGVR